MLSEEQRNEITREYNDRLSKVDKNAFDINVQIKEFERAIEEYEDQLFGVNLRLELYEKNPKVLRPVFEFELYPEYVEFQKKMTFKTWNKEKENIENALESFKLQLSIAKTYV